MAARRKYKKPISVNVMVEYEKMEILRSIYKVDAVIVNKALDLLLQISYEGRKVKSEYLSSIRAASVQTIEEESRKIKTIDDLLEGRIQAEKKEKKAHTDLKKIAAALIRENHIEWDNDQPVIRTDKLVDMCNRFSEEIGIPVTPKMLLTELEAQKKAMA